MTFEQQNVSTYPHITSVLTVNTQPSFNMLGVRLLLQIQDGNQNLKVI